MRGPIMAGRGRSIALQSISTKKCSITDQQVRRAKCTALQSISAIYTPKTAGQMASAKRPFGRGQGSIYRSWLAVTSFHPGIRATASALLIDDLCGLISCTRAFLVALCFGLHSGTSEGKKAN